MVSERRNRFIRFTTSALILLIPVVLLIIAFASPSPSSIQPAMAAPAEREVRQELPTVQFSNLVYRADENDSDNTVAISVQVSAVPTETNKTITVTYATADGTAISGLDYAATSGQLIFAPGDSVIKTFNLTLVNDNNPEEDETIVLILQSPQNATLGSRSISELIIENDDASPTPTSNAATPIFSDIYESNNTLSTAYTLIPGDGTFCSNNDATLWPAGDEDYYRFWGKSGFEYNIETANLDTGIDTLMALFDGSGGYLSEDDDNGSGRASAINFESSTNSYYYIRITDKDPTDPADRTYCVRITETALPTATPDPTGTPIPSATPVPGADECENNFDIDNACLIAPDQILSLNFVPAEGTDTDNDYFQMWVRQGWTYTCDTEVNEFNDTNMILYDQNGNGIAGNNDKSFDDLGSSVTLTMGYTGWLYVLVGPVVPLEYAESFRYTYTLTCLASADTPTPTPTNTLVPATGGNTGGVGGGVPVVPTSTPTLFAPPTEDPMIAATLDALATSIAEQANNNQTATPTPPVSVGIVPLPTEVPTTAPVLTASMSVVLFYDGNDNNLPELNEGIQNMAVFVYDATTGQLLTLGYTNEAGTLQFTVAPSGSMVRIAVPYFGIDQMVTNNTNELLIRVAPRIVAPIAPSPTPSPTPEG